MSIADGGSEFEDARRRLNDLGQAAGPTGEDDADAAAAGALRLVHAVALRAEEAGPAELLAALVLLRHLREELASWEPELIAAARRRGVSWAQLAPALGVTSRQAAERRYLRQRPAADGDTASTGDQRIKAERDRRASDRVVSRWARQNSASLRQLAGQVSALPGLAAVAQRQVELVQRALAHDDAARLLAPLADTRSHLEPTHPDLADRIDAIIRYADWLRRDTHARRRTTEQAQCD